VRVPIRFSLRALLLLLSAATGAQAQRVAGVVRDSASGRPIPGAVVMAVDATGASVARTIADATGGFRLELGANAQVLQIRRIGFYPRDIALTDAVRANAAALAVALRQVTATLEAVVVKSARSCPTSSTTEQAMALWEQARIGFLASVVARDARPATVRTIRHTQLVADGSMLQNGFTRFDGSAARPFPSVRTAADLAAAGYAFPNGSTWLYFPPDADILMDDAFRATHCFGLGPADRARPGQISVAFTPTPLAPGAISHVEVSGTLWLDRAPLGLRSLDFTFERAVGLGLARGAGGSLSFRTADNGVTIVDRWASLFSATIGGTNVTKFQGGELLSARWPDGASITRALNTIEGKVVEQGTGRPLPGVVVAVPSTPMVALTSSTGTFTFRDVPPGPYRVEADDPTGNPFLLGRSGTAEVTVREGRPATVELQMPPLETIAANRCGMQKLAKERSAIALRVIDSVGNAFSRQPLIIWWGAMEQWAADTVRVQTSSSGRLFLCDLVPNLVHIDVLDHRGVPVTVAQVFTHPAGVFPVTIRLAR
jgi:hypothetical protein